MINEKYKESVRHCQVCGYSIVETLGVFGGVKCPLCENWIELPMERDSFIDYIERVNTQLMSNCIAWEDGDYSEKWQDLPIVILDNKVLRNDYCVKALRIFKNFHPFRPNSRDKPYVICEPWCSLIEKDFSNIGALQNLIKELNRSSNFVYGKVCGSIVISPSMLILYIMFWNLLFASLNNEGREENLSVISDLACMFGITESIMSDLCRGVKYVIDGREVSCKCDLICETSWCKDFFKGHKPYGKKHYYAEESPTVVNGKRVWYSK